MTEYKMHSSPDFRYDCIASAMTLKRYQILRRHFHANDNTGKNNEQNVNAKLFKAGPLLELMRNNYIKIDPEQCHSIDEQVSPAKTIEVAVSSNTIPKKSINGDSKTWSELVSLGLSMVSLCMDGNTAWVLRSAVQKSQ